MYQQNNRILSVKKKNKSKKLQIKQKQNKIFKKMN